MERLHPDAVGAGAACRRSSATIWCKLEFLNPSGSTKDRIAKFILEKAWRKGLLGPGERVVEASSGSTSIAMAQVCARLGLRFTAVMPEGVSHERVLIIKAYGGEIRLTPAADGMRGALDETERMARESKVFLPRQFSNWDNAEAHRIGTAREIIEQMQGRHVDAVVSGVGTGGTLVGLHLGLRECGCRVVPVCAAGERHPRDGSRMLQLQQPDSGRGRSACRPFSTKSKLPGLITIEVDDNAALETARQLIRRGFPVGPSFGLNYAAAVLAASRLAGDNPQIVTVFPDRMERYFTTEFLRAP